MTVFPPSIFVIKITARFFLHLEHKVGFIEVSPYRAFASKEYITDRQSYRRRIVNDFWKSFTDIQGPWPLASRIAEPSASMTTAKRLRYCRNIVFLQGLVIDGERAARQIARIFARGGDIENLLAGGQAAELRAVIADGQGRYSGCPPDRGSSRASDSRCRRWCSP